MLSAAGGGAVGVAADVDELVGLALLAPPLQVVVHADVGYAEICAEMTLVGVPLAEVS